MNSDRSDYYIALAIAVVIAFFGAAHISANCGHCGPATAATNAVEKALKHPTLVGTEALAQMIASNTPMTIVDARSGTYDDVRRIANAKQLASDAKGEVIAKALPDKNAVIVAYCTNTKCPASAKLAARLIALGYTKVHKYPDGIEGWVAAGKPVSGGSTK